MSKHRAEGLSGFSNDPDALTDEYKRVADGRALGTLPEMSWSQMGARGALGIAGTALLVMCLNVLSQSADAQEEPILPHSTSDTQPVLHDR